MSARKLLVDTNVVIGLEDAHAVKAALAELVRSSSEHGVRLFVGGANYDDVNRDKDEDRRKITLSKLDKFEKLGKVAVPPQDELVKRFGPATKPNDESDIQMLAILDTKVVDFLVTEDVRLHKRAEKAGIDGSVLTVEEALEWLRRSYVPQSVNLPLVVPKKAYEVDQKDAIFVSLRADYPEFDKWFQTCIANHRDCWVLELGEETAGIVIRKDETHQEAGTLHPGPKILKVSTFKVRDEYRGEKFGELLLKQILWFAQANDYDLVYLTVFPKHEFLVTLLESYGFTITKKRDNEELFMEKPIIKGAVARSADPIIVQQRTIYPRFYDGDGTGKYCVPIWPEYHQRLFPEIARGSTLPLFSEFDLPLTAAAKTKNDRIPGNTIRKVYVCKAKIRQIQPGDIIMFYVSKDDAYAASQSITTIGIAEQITVVTTADDLIRLTAKRSVYSVDELVALRPSIASPVLAIDFLLVGHLKSEIPLDRLVSGHVFSGRPPQSIASLTGARYDALRSMLHLDFPI